MMYFVIGYGTFHVLTYNELKERLNEEYYGDDAFIEGDLDEIPKETDPAYWGGKYVIVKGEFSFPEPVKVVIEWDLK